MRKFALFVFACALFSFVSNSYAGIGLDSSSYIINLSKTPVLQEGVVNASVKALLGKIVNENLDKSKTIQIFGDTAEVSLLEEVGSIYGYKVEVIESNAKDTNNYVDVANMPISSFVIPEEFANEGVTLDKVLNAFYEVEKSGYQADVLANAMNLLTELVNLLKLPIDVIQAISNTISAGETVSTFVSTIIDLLTNLFSNITNAKPVASKDVQYSDTIDNLLGPIVHAVAVPGIEAVNSIATPLLQSIGIMDSGGTMVPGVTKMLMQVMFPVLDVVFNSMPILRPIAADLMAPVMSHMH